MSAERSPDLDRYAGDGRPDGHDAAVLRTLGWADEAAERGDYHEALEWLGAIEAMADELPPLYHEKRRAWEAGLSAGP